MEKQNKQKNHWTQLKVDEATKKINQEIYKKFVTDQFISVKKMKEANLPEPVFINERKDFVVTF